MTKAEQRAFEAYPVNMTPLVYQDLIDQFGGKTEIDVNTYPRCLFQQGYSQAEKDLALTWEDMFLVKTVIDGRVEQKEPGVKGFYEAVLQRYIEVKASKR